MNRGLWIAAAMLTLIAVGCSSGTDESADTTNPNPTTVPEASTTSTPQTTSSAPGSPTTTTLATTTTAAPFTVVKDVVYMTRDGVDLELDVYVPAAVETAAPVLVTFHGLSGSGKSDPDTTAVAKEAANSGMVVFVPSWFIGTPIPIDADKLALSREVANCAVAFAQGRATEYGGDAADTVIDGFSAGIVAALYASLDHIDEPVPGCAVAGPAIEAKGVVLGDGEPFLHASIHDEPFADDPAGMRAVVDGWLNASAWPPELETEFFIWYSADGNNPRRTRDLDDPTGWLALRDGDGSIRTDLEQLGLLDDGIVSTVDAAQLLDLRLSEGDVTVTLDEYPGAHTTLDKVTDLVGYFEAAANR